MSDEPMLAVPVALAQWLSEYLGRQPHDQVAQPLAMLRQCKPVAQAAVENPAP
ncbi:hypothetical protein [Rhodovarius lipocyclicus]|uniref:hypothetical protein n=1 Tax=Rhodovarius lipocyclicus TaxID=268410 RepID=UPI001356B718|nr:hypothetical protein [Rhodovarius lipocyclicus]